MKVHISVTDDNGVVFEGEVHLTPAGAGRAAKRPARARDKAKTVLNAAPIKLDFTKPERAFVKTHAKGLSGSRKFVLLLAYLAKGVPNKEVPLNDVKKVWNRMTARLGKFNPFYTNEAKENGWVHTMKKGGYVLTTTWREAFE